MPLQKELFVIINADGPDVDSGTAVEYGEAIQSTNRAVVYRTDFRGGGEDGTGINIMLSQNFGNKRTITVFFPAFLKEIDEIEDYYKELAARLDRAIKTALS